MCSLDSRTPLDSQQIIWRRIFIKTIPKCCVLEAPKLIFTVNQRLPKSQQQEELEIFLSFEALAGRRSQNGTWILWCARSVKQLSGSDLYLYLVLTPNHNDWKTELLDGNPSRRRGKNPKIGFFEFTMIEILQVFGNVAMMKTFFQQVDEADVMCANIIFDMTVPALLRHTDAMMCQGKKNILPPTPSTPLYNLVRLSQTCQQTNQGKICKKTKEIGTALLTTANIRKLIGCLFIL